MLGANHAMLRINVLPVKEDGIYKTIIAICAALVVINALLLHLVAEGFLLHVLVPVKMVASLATLIIHAQNAQKSLLSIKDNASPVVIAVVNAKCFKRVGQVI